VEKMKKLTDEHIIKALEDYKNSKILQTENGVISIGDILDLINRKDAKVELLTMDVNSLTSERDALQEMVVEQKAEIERLNNELVSADEVIGFREAEIERLKDKIFVLENDLEKAENLNDAFGNDVDIKLNHIYALEEKLAKAKSEAYKEFAEMVVSDYPETDYYLEKLLKELTEGGNEPPKNDFKE
jgi:chromosome segregation ATPase